jgi:hypothetical protein
VTRFAMPKFQISLEMLAFLVVFRNFHIEGSRPPIWSHLAAYPQPQGDVVCVPLALLVTGPSTPSNGIKGPIRTGTLLRRLQRGRSQPVQWYNLRPRFRGEPAHPQAHRGGAQRRAMMV